MIFGTYGFHVVFDSPAMLPPYKGSTLRGVLGHALKSVVCALRRQECTRCLLKAQCLYPMVFETPLVLAPPETPGAPATPHPFVLTPPDTRQTEYRADDALDFSLSLFGSVNDNLPYFVYAVETMGRSDIGRGARSAGGRFKLASVDAGGRTIYTAATGRLATPTPTEDIAVGTANELSVHRLNVAFHTPLRIKHDNRLKDRLPFHVLTRAMLRRISALMTCYGDGEPALDYRGLVHRAGSIQTVDDTLRWVDWRRYSNRQKTGMLMGGLVGEVSYAGDLSEFLPLVEFCSRVNIGKQTSFGLGRFSVEVVA